MFQLLVVFLVGGQCVLGARQLRGQAARRDGKSLVGTFPFNANAEDHHGGHHGEHHDERTASQSLAGRAQRQGGDDTDVSFGAVAAAGPGSDGKRCIDKVEMVEETEYDDVVQCDHSYDKRCHTTYVTTYESQQEEECEENYRKTVLLSMRRLLSMRLLIYAELLLSRIVMSRDLRSAELSMSLSAGPSRRFMTLRMMLLSARLRLRRNVKMKPLDIPLTPSAQSGPRRSALFLRKV